MAPPLHVVFFFNDTATPDIYTLSLHDALPISLRPVSGVTNRADLRRHRGHHAHGRRDDGGDQHRSEEHTSELQSHVNLVCRLLLEKKKERDLTRGRLQAVDTGCGSHLAAQLSD